MRCEDCLPLVEEYSDGEVEGRVGEQIRAHLSICETCAAALDALSFEQEIYARYDRKLEVSPTLWARVSAEIAREPLQEKPVEGHSFLTRLRHTLAAALGALNARPALASALALLFLGIIAGSLRLAHAPRTAAPTEVAESVPVKNVVVNPTAPAVSKKDAAHAPSPLTINSVDGSPATAEMYRDNSREYVAAARPRVSQPSEVGVETLLTDAPALKVNPNIVFIRPDDHASETADNAALFVNASASDRGVHTVEDSRLLDPAEKELARHVEQAQMLLRSFKNARSAEGETVNVAYERKLSRRLLAENATLKLDAETRGDKDTKQVLDSIEPFLLDIANLREQPSREEVRSIRERMRKNEIIAALQVY